MKLSIILIIFIAVNFFEASAIRTLKKAKKRSINQRYKLFLSKYKEQKEIEFRNDTIEEERMEQFERIAGSIDEHNLLEELGVLTYRREPMWYSDYTYEEKLKALCGTRLPPKARAVSPLLRTCRFWPKAPDAVNWCNKFPNGIRDQQTCGCCWAFSVIQVVEYYIWNHFKKNPKLSVQELVDCNDENQGCDGGWPSFGFRHVGMFGLTGWDTYKYENEQQKSCRKASYRKVLESHFVKKYLEVELKGDEECLKKIISKVGPVSIAVHADEFFMSYASGYYRNDTCPQNDPNHAMVLCGYGTDLDFGDYWLIRNSWGTSWGENGLVRMARGNTCGVASWAMWPVIIGAEKYLDPFEYPSNDNNQNLMSSGKPGPNFYQRMFQFE